MKRVLLVGLDPATVDFSDPALPPGMTADKIHAGVKLVLADMTERGWVAENCFINPDETAVPTVERRLAAGRYDCVVIGAACGTSGRALIDPKRSDGSPVTCRSIDVVRTFALGELPETGCSGHPFATRTRSRGRAWGRSRLSRRAHRPGRCS
jgi:hypothetical protein